MANPTVYYQWEYPTRGQNPWYMKFLGQFMAQESTIRSLETLIRALGRTTLIVSMQGNQLPIPSSTSATFFPVSADPFGRAQGLFYVPCSGAQVRFEFEAMGRAGGLPTDGTVVKTGAFFYNTYRLVTTASYNITGDSFWVFRFVPNMVNFPLRFTAIASMAAGYHVVELQAGGEFGGGYDAASFGLLDGPINLWGTPFAS